MTDLLTIICGDALTELRKLPDASVQCCVTSPPYWGLRDYGTGSWEGGEDGCDHEGDQRHYTEKTAAVCSADAFSEPGQANIDRLKEGRWRNNGTCVKCGAIKQDSQLGLEKTPEEYVAKMVEVFREVSRVLRKDGTLWLNLGDSYASGGRGGGAEGEAGEKQRSNQGALLGAKKPPPGLKTKDLCGIPWRVAFALQADGWYLRSDVIEEVEFYCPCGCGYIMEERIWRWSQDRELIWRKSNPMPESTRDRPTKSHEYLFLFTKNSRYFYDAEAIAEQSSLAMLNQMRHGYDGEATKDYEKNGVQNPSSVKSRIIENARRKHRLPAGWDTSKGGCHGTIHREGRSPTTEYSDVNSVRRNKRSVWTIATAPYAEAHFATFPPDLIKPCVLAGTSAKGCCAKCGAPLERLVEREKQPRGDCFGKRDGAFDHGQSGSTYQETVSTETVGWRPTCKCDAAIEPCVVLDPFAGSGTTGMVALELGRKAVLIELNPKYIPLIEQRCNVTPGLALA
jgi:DNA modification methylase